MYLPSSGTPPVTPSAWAGWSDGTGSAFTYPFSTTKSSSSMSTFTLTDPTTSGATVVGRWVSPPLSAVTITGTWRYTARHTNVQSSGYCKGNAVLKVVSNDGTTVRGTLISRLGPSHTVAFNTSNSFRSITNPEWEGTITVTSVAASEDDRLVFEVGGYNQNSSTDDVSFSFGDDAGTDLDFSNSDTGADNPWMELSQTLTFNEEGGGGPTGPFNQLMLTGCGT